MAVKSKRLNEYQPYLAGPKRYGGGLSNAPTVGPVDPMGYRERDVKIRARQRAIRARMKNINKNTYLRQEIQNPFGGL